MPTMTNPNPCIGSAVLDNATDGSALFRALGGHYTSPAQAVCEFIDDSLSSIAARMSASRISSPEPRISFLRSRSISSGGQSRSSTATTGACTLL